MWACPRFAGSGHGPAGAARRGRSAAAKRPDCPSRRGKASPSPSLHSPPGPQATAKRTPCAGALSPAAPVLRTASVPLAAAEGARRAASVARVGCAQHRFPDFFASSANATSGPRRFAALRLSAGGVHKASLYKPSPTPKAAPDTAHGTAKNSGKRCKQRSLVRATDNC